MSHRSTGRLLALALVAAQLAGCASTASATPGRGSATPAAAGSVAPSAPASARPSPPPASVPGVTPSAAEPTPTISTGPDGIALAMSSASRPTTTPAQATQAAAEVNAFGLALLRRLASGGGNSVISPASIAIALAMARAGARGETATQMDAVLHGFGSDAQATGVNALDASLAALNQVFAQYALGPNAPPEVALQIANAPFAQRDLALEPAYLDALATRFGAGLRLVDFKADPDGARRAINAWVKAQTHDRIPELLGPPAVTRRTRIALVNTIYLKAPWQEPFQTQATAPAPFTLADGSTVSVPTMAGSYFYPYARGTGWWAVQLPYLGTLALTIIVPDDLAAFSAALTPAELGRISAALTPQPIALHLPRIGANTGPVNLTDALAAMGMPIPFDMARADFSGITRQEPLYISAVVHQANIDIDEQGTEAAAATAVLGSTGGPGYMGPWRELRVDRPFLFALRDTATGAVLFLGRVTDPSKR